MEKKAGVFRASLIRRVSFAATALVFLVIAVVLWLVNGDGLPLRLCILIVPGSLISAYYIHRIILRIDDAGISLYWPLHGEKRLKWDEVTQVRRSEAPPGKYFFIDLIASADRSVLFNPYFFERPRDIIRELNEHLKFDLLKGEIEDQGAVAEEIAAAADPPQHHLSNSQWIMIAIILIILAAGLFYCLR